MLIRKNTKAFKTILEIISACQNRPDREKLIRLYITKAGNTIKDRISVDAIEGEASLFYEMNYQAIFNNLKSSSHQLVQSDEVPGIYFFHSSSNKLYDETPFEFDEAVGKEFSALPDLPAFRKKEKAAKFVIPRSPVKTASSPAKAVKKEKKQKLETLSKGPQQPNYKLKHQFDFTNIDKIVFRHPKLSKKEILDYYSDIAEYLLPYLKDRAQVLSVRTNDRTLQYADPNALSVNGELPQWLQTGRIPKNGSPDLIHCNDRDHLLYYVEKGCIQFNTSHARIKSFEFPDYIIVGIESVENALGKAIDVSLAVKEILSGLQLPSFIKIGGVASLNIYIPLDAKTKVQTCVAAAYYVGKLVRLKVPNLVTLNNGEDTSFGKVLLEPWISKDKDSVIAPYSLVAGESAIVATPLLWEEVNEGLNIEDFNYQTIFKRLETIGDPFKTLFRKKVNAEELFAKLKENYSFLL
jgi:DNA primase